MTSNEYRQLSSELYAKATAIKPSINNPEVQTLLLITYHLQQAGKVAREAAEAKERLEPIPVPAPVPEAAEAAITDTIPQSPAKKKKAGGRT